jgi:hypothetical protein
MPVDDDDDEEMDTNTPTNYDTVRRESTVRGKALMERASASEKILRLIQDRAAPGTELFSLAQPTAWVTSFSGFLYDT